MTSDNTQETHSNLFNNIFGDKISPSDRISLIDSAESPGDQSTSNSLDLGTVQRRLSDLVQDYNWSNDWIPKPIMSQDRSMKLTPISSTMPPLSQSALTNSPLNSNSMQTAAITSSEHQTHSKKNAKRVAGGRNKRNAGSGPKTRPAFVLKLWNMLNDSRNHEYIQWVPDGQSFQVLGREPFEKFVLPRYFKHSNFSSFVRQLNMYGWHKVQDVTSGAMQSNDEIWQFKSPNFIRGREDLLDNIVRNKGSKGSDDEDDYDMGKVLDELELIKSNQQLIAEDLNRIRNDNQLLWRECFDTRERHKAQSEAFEKILRFLAAIYATKPSKFVNDLHGNSKQPLLLLPNLQELTGNNISSAEPDKAALSAIEDLISATGSNSSGSSDDVKSSQRHDHNRIASIGSIDDMKPIINEAETPSTGSNSPRNSIYTPISKTPNSKANHTTLDNRGRSSSGDFKVVELNSESSGTKSKKSSTDSLSDLQSNATKLSSDDFSTELNGGALVQSNDQYFPNLAQLSTPSSTIPLTTNSVSITSSAPPVTAGISNPATMANLNDPSSNSPISQRFINTNNELNSISKSLDMQGQSLQYVHDWVQKMAPQYDFSLSPKTSSLPDGSDPSLNLNQEVPNVTMDLPINDPISPVNVNEGFNVDDFLNSSNEIIDDPAAHNPATDPNSNTNNTLNNFPDESYGLAMPGAVNLNMDGHPSKKPRLE